MTAPSIDKNGVAVSARAPAYESESLLDIFADLLRRWKLIAAFAVLGAGGSVIYALILKPVYRAQVIVAPVGSDSGGSSIARLASQLGPIAGLVGDLGISAAGGRREVALATLKSRGVLEEFIQRSNVMPLLFAKNWDDSAQDWKKINGVSLQPTIDDAVLLLQNGVISIGEDRRTGLVTVAAEWPDPEIAAKWANDVVALTNDLIRRRAIDESQRNLEYLQGELKKSNAVELQQIIYRLIESRTGEIMMANGRVEYAFVVIDRASPPDVNKPSKPKRRIIVLAGTSASILLGLVVAFTIGIMEKRKSTRSGN